MHYKISLYKKNCLYMKCFKKALFTSALALASMQSFNNADATIYVNAGAGTTGISVGASWYFKNVIGIRGEYAFMPSQVLSFATDVVKKSSDYITDAKSKFHSGGIDLSIRPFKGAFRIDAGMRIMNYSMSIDGYSMINDYYNAYATGDVTFVIAKGVKPYFGLGWDFNPFLGFTIGFDIGVIYTGQWKVDKLNVDVNYGTMPENLQDTAFASDIENAKNDIKSIKGDVNDSLPKFLQFWPVIKLNIGYKFNVLF